MKLKPLLQMVNRREKKPSKVLHQVYHHIYKMQKRKNFKINNYKRNSSKRYRKQMKALVLI